MCAIITLRIAICSFLLIIISGCHHHKNIVKKVYLHSKSDCLIEPTYIPPCKDIRTVTIWIHGTCLFPNVTFKTTFEGNPHIKRLDELQPQCRLAEIAHKLIASNPQSFHPDDYYIFGWSGELSFKTRRETAMQLLNGIKKISQHYKDHYGYRPKMRLICHSHGGNVALNMAHFLESAALTIDELVLLACPVQNHTKSCVAHPMFKSIYSLSSALDLIQIIDPQGLYAPEGIGSCAFFSERLFRPAPHIIQARVKIHKRAITHTEFTQSNFLCNLAIILEELRIWNKQQVGPYKKSDQLTTCIIDITNKAPSRTMKL